MADRAAPLVSAVITVRNGGPFLQRAIDSLLTQTLADIEVVVVDDGSTDDTPAVLAAAAARDSRVRVFTRRRPASRWRPTAGSPKRAPT